MAEPFLIGRNMAVRSGLALSLALLPAAPSQAQEVELYARCTLGETAYELGQRRDAFDTPVARRAEGGGWTDLTLPRYGWLMHSPEVAAHWQDGGRTLAVACRPGAPGPAEARFAWLENGLDGTKSGNGEASCQVLREHSATSTLIGGERGGPAGDTMLGRCDLGGLRLVFSTDAAADYLQYWQRGDEAGQAVSLVNYVARSDRRRGFAFDDGLGLYLVGHSAEGEAAAAFVLIGGTTLGSGQARGTCEVLE